MELTVGGRQKYQSSKRKSSDAMALQASSFEKKRQISGTGTITTI